MQHRFVSIFARTAICLLVLVGSPVLIAQSQANPAQPFAPDTLLVVFNPGTAASEMGAAHSQAGGNVLKTIAAIGVQVVAVPNGTVLEAVQRYQRNPNVTFAEPNYQRPLFLPVTTEGSEPSLQIQNFYDEQWGLHNTGQSFGATVDPLFGTLITPAYTGVADADIDAEEGWGITHGSAAIRIAILDSGVYCSHADLALKCIEQVNFVDEHGSPLDDILGHGTHVAGIAAAKLDNTVGIAGVAWEASIGSLKVCYEDYSLALFGIIQGVCEDADIAEAITQAADTGYHVINMSLSGPQFSQTLLNAVDYAWDQGVVIVARAGNGYSTEPLYPAGYDNVMAVAATDYFDNLAYFSTFGNWVSVLAPGHTILSTVPNELCNMQPDDPEGCHDWKSGTSMATPYVAGIAAMVWAHLPAPTNAQVRSSIENSAEEVGALGQNFLAWVQHGLVNLYEALMYDSGGPAPGGGGGDTSGPVISNVLSENLNGNRFEITWTTDESATSMVTFTCCGDMSDDALVTGHRMTFRGGKGVLYQYTVTSTDATGNSTTDEGPYFHQN